MLAIIENIGPSELGQAVEKYHKRMIFMLLKLRRKEVRHPNSFLVGIYVGHANDSITVRRSGENHHQTFSSEEVLGIEILTEV